VYSSIDNGAINETGIFRRRVSRSTILLCIISMRSPDVAQIDIDACQEEAVERDALYGKTKGCYGSKIERGMDLMLTIKTGTGNVPHQWNVGDKLPMNKVGSMSSYPLTSIVSVEANEDELSYLRSRFKNLPDTNTDHVKWGQPFAQFIYENLL
jgi:hypothetical protein